MTRNSNQSWTQSSLTASVTSALGAAAAGLLPTPAHAHILMEGTLKGRGGDQKMAPCEGAPRSATPYTFEPGATIELAVIEAIAHDGYFRISFDNDGTDFKDPQSIAPLNPDRYGPGMKCQGTPEDHCGESDFCNMISDGNGPTVLWDRLDPHLGVEATFGQVRSWRVTLPNVECDNCTLQVMQVMEDPAGGAHGPFDGKSDLYYQCVDIVLKKGAGNTPGTVTGPASNNGMECAKTSGGDGGTDQPEDESDDDDGGCSVVASRSDRPFSALLALIAGALLLHRRVRPPPRS